MFVDRINLPTEFLQLKNGEKMAIVHRPTVKIKALKTELIETLQDYCRSQVNLWRQVPSLAQEADRLKGHTSGRYQMAYLSGYWPISSDIHGLWVVLQIGELGRSHLFDEIELGKLDSILQALDANEVVRSLRNEITLPLSARLSEMK